MKYTLPAFLLVTSTALAQLPRTTIDSLYPPAGQQGTEIQVKVKGKETEDATWLRFTHEGIRAKQKLDDAGDPINGEYTVTIGKDVPIGLYEARVGGGRFGVSDISTFLVGSRPHHWVENGNQSMEKALEIETGHAYIGKSIARGYSYFSFTAKKGEGLIIHCAAGEFDSAMKPVLKVLGENGRELAGEPLDGYLEFTTEEDGKYFLQIFDFLYTGSDNHYYKLTISKRPQIDLVDPPVGEPGTKAQFTLYGRNLPDGKPSGLKLPDGSELKQIQAEIELPANPSEKDLSQITTKLTPKQILLPVHTWRLQSGEGLSNPIFIGLSDNKVVPETNQPNELPEQAQEIEVPCEFVGKFFPFADKDYLQFKAKKGDKYVIEAISERLGQPSNIFLLVQQVTLDAKGVELVKNIKEALDNPSDVGGLAFKTNSNDPEFDFTAPVDGTYRILAYDLFDRGVSDIRNQYRISIRQARPDFTLAAFIKSPPSADGKTSDVNKWPAAMRKNEILPIQVIAARKDSFDAPIALELKGLPASIDYSPKTIPASTQDLTVMLKTAPDAKAWDGNLEITGRAKVGDKEITRKCHPAAVVYASYDSRTKATVVDTRLVSKLTLSVNDKEVSPVTVSPGATEIENCVKNVVKIPFKISQTDEGFKQARKVKVVGHPLLAKAKEVNLDTKKDEGEIELDLNQLKVPEGEYPVYLSADIKGKYQLYTDEDKKAADQKAKDLDKESKEAAEAAKKADADYKAALQNKDLATEEKDKLKKGSEDAAQKSKLLADKLKKTQELAKTIAAGVKPKDINETFYSPAILIRVTPSPLKIPEIETVQLSPDTKVDWNFSFERLYGYNETVAVSFTYPSSLKGVSIKNTTIAKDKNGETFQIECAKTATSGDFEITVKMTVKVNNQNLGIEANLPVSIAKAVAAGS